MKELKLLKNYTFDPETRECRFQSFDEQLAQRIMFDDKYDPEDFDEDDGIWLDTYDDIEEAVEDRLEELGFKLSDEQDLIDNVYNIIKETICGE